MKIIVIGASKGIGLATVESLLHAGHDVTAFSRHASDMKIKNKRLKLIDGNVLDKRILEQAIKGQDAVICTLGLPTRYAIGPPFALRSYVLSEGTENIIVTMERLHTKRLLCVTAIGSGDSAKSCTAIALHGLRIGLRWLFKEKDNQDALIRSSSLDWTIIQPTALTNSDTHRQKDNGKGTYGILSHISRMDVAKEMTKIVGDRSTYKKAIILSYQPRFGDTVRWVKGYLNI
jgi:putative NADH-flavin reductase